MADASELDALSLLIDRFNDEKRCAVELAQFEQAFERAKAAQRGLAIRSPRWTAIRP